jgi:hypothetical protein
MLEVIGSIVGGLIGGNSAKKAAQAQADATREATRVQKEMFDKQIELQEPWRQAGGLGLNRMAYEMGLSDTGTFQPGTVETADQIRARLTPQYMPTGQPAAPTGAGDWAEQQMDFMRNGSPLPGASPGAGVGGTDGAALEAAVQAELQRQQASRPSAVPPGGGGKFGSLLKDFSMEDFEADPGYAFRMSEGQKALDRAGAAGGRFNSGRSMKDILRFSQGLGAQEYGAAYDRYNNNRTQRFNRLASISGVGQTAANNAGAAAQNYGSAAGGNVIGAGNAAAAGQVGMANAITGGIGQGISSYQNNKMMSLFNTPQQGYGSSAMNNHFFGNGTGGD